MKMLNPIEAAIMSIRKSDKIGLMSHMIVGYPALDTNVEMAKMLEQAGSDLIEVQIPFSDPIADGPTIMEACDVSLKNGTTTKIALKEIGKIIKTVSVPVLIMAYYNTIFSYGTEAFCKMASKLGVAGLIVPDMPPEEEARERFMEYCLQNNLYAIRVVSPASSDIRLKLNAKYATGFLYTTSRYGVTGAKTDLDPRLAHYIKKLRNFFTIPVAVGFGISKPEHTRGLKGSADIAIVGSAIIDVTREATGNGKTNFRKVEQFVRSLKQ